MPAGVEERLAALEVGWMSYPRGLRRARLGEQEIDDLNHSLSRRIDDVRSDMSFRFNVLLALDMCILGAILGVLFKMIFP